MHVSKPFKQRLPEQADLLPAAAHASRTAAHAYSPVAAMGATPSICCTVSQMVTLEYHQHLQTCGILQPGDISMCRSGLEVGHTMELGSTAVRPDSF